jgi:hypothetical protein
MTPESSLFPAVNNPFDTPFILSQVSQHWCQLLLSTPSLWTLINIRLSTRPHLQSRLRYFYTSLKRSGTRELTVVVTQATTECLPHHARTYAALCIAAPRLHALIVYSSVVIARAMGATLELEHFPTLKAFVCVAPPTYHSAGWTMLSTHDMRNVTLALDHGGPFPNAPCLRGMYIDIGLDPLYHVRVCSASMTHLVLLDEFKHFRLGVSEALGVLRACPMLEECVLGVDIWSTPRPVLNGVTTVEQQDATLIVFMQHLRWVHLCLRGKLGYLTDRIKAPALKVLYIRYLSNGGPIKRRNCYCSLASFVARSSPDLKTVEVEGFPVPLKELVHGVEPLSWDGPSTRATGLRKVSSEVVEVAVHSTCLPTS